MRSYLSGPDLTAVHHVGPHAAEQLLRRSKFRLRSPDHKSQLARSGGAHTWGREITLTHKAAYASAISDCWEREAVTTENHWIGLNVIVFKINI